MISATHSATSSLQSVFTNSRLNQARQEARQAQATAGHLRSRANAAEQDAAHSQERVQALSREQPTIDPTYQQKASHSEGELSLQTQQVVVTAYAASAASRASTHSVLKTDMMASPVTNSQGNLTGRIVDLQA